MMISLNGMSSKTCEDTTSTFFFSVSSTPCRQPVSGRRKSPSIVPPIFLLGNSSFLSGSSSPSCAASLGGGLLLCSLIQYISTHSMEKSSPSMPKAFEVTNPQTCANHRGGGIPILRVSRSIIPSGMGRGAQVEEEEEEEDSRASPSHSGTVWCRVVVSAKLLRGLTRGKVSFSSPVTSERRAVP